MNDLKQDAATKSAQDNELDTFCDNFTDFADDVKEDMGIVLEDYAYELYQNYELYPGYDAERAFIWNYDRNKLENIRTSILSGETGYLRYFLNEVSPFYSKAADLLEDLNKYEANYPKERQDKIMENKSGESIKITVSNGSNRPNSFKVTSVGFDIEKKYTVAEFNQALKNANEKWQENWDGLSYPSNIVIITVENLHKVPCTYSINLVDADYDSIQDIVKLSPVPIRASIPTDEAIEKLNKAETIPLQRDISHKTNADPAKRVESRGKIMEQNTKFEVSTMSKLEGEGAKAIATLIVNGEFAVHGVTVRERKDGSGLYASMPREKQPEKQPNGEYKDVYKDVVFPITKEAREAINNAVMGAYEKLAVSPEQTLKNEITTPEKTSTKVYAQMHEVNSEKQTKAAGQITLDGCLVVTGVKLNEGTNQEGQTKTFVAMPAKPNNRGGFDDIAHPITADFHKSVDKSVIASANNIGRYEYKGVKYEELGENPIQSSVMTNKYADKLMAELDKAGIKYQAKCAERTVITVANADKQSFDAVKKDLTDRLNGKDKAQPAQTQSQTHSKPKTV